MRILFLTHRLPYAPNRGDRTRAFYLLREMSRFADVSLFSFVHDDKEMAQREAVPYARDVTCVRVRRLPNLVRGALRLPTSRPLTHSLIDAGDARATLDALFEDHAPDLVVAFCSSMARFALEPPLDRCRFVLDLVDVDSVKWAHLADVVRPPMRWIYQREARTLGAFEAAAASKAEVTLVVNERERAALKRIAPSADVKVLAPGIDVESFKPPNPPGETTDVVFCGVMDYEPNERGVGWFASHVWPRVRSAVPNARFVIVGSGPTRAVRRLAARDASIEIVGAVPSVQPYLWKSALSVAPLHLAQGLQTKVLEALAAGLPVVVTPAVLQGLPVDAHCGCLVADDAAGFASHVIDLLRISPDERRRRAALTPIRALQWSEQLRDLEAILRQAMSSPRSRPADTESRARSGS
jgi:sugar transferase (PEP-CTERM/EpsH1 system associated)